MEIFISDNSTDDATEKFIETCSDARIKYFRHKNFTAHDNWNFARDYDNPDVSLVTSKRNIMDADGKILGHHKVPFKASAKISGEEAGRILFSNFENFIGEPTTVLIRKRFLRDGDLCRHADERGFFNLVDTSTWLQLLSKGNLFFIDEPLSCYRLHANIATDWLYTAPPVAIQWAKMIKSAWEKKIFLKTEKDVRQSILKWFNFIDFRGLQHP